MLIALSIWIVYSPVEMEEPSHPVISESAEEIQISMGDMSDKVILIGAIAAKTGEASEINNDMFTALSYAVEELNSKGGILGRQIKIYEFDNKSTALGARQAAMEAAKTDIVAVIGSIRSSYTLAAAEILQDSGIPMITPISTNPDVTKVGDYIFRACFNDNFQGEVLARFARNDLQTDRAVTLTNVNRIFSITLSEIFKQTYIELGGSLLADMDYLNADTDFTHILKEVADLDPQVIMIPSEDQDTGLIIKQSREMGIDAVFIGPDSWSKRLYDYAGEYADGNYYSTHWHKDQDTEVSRDFVLSYPDENEDNLRAYHALTYDAMAILADAIRRAGSLDRDKIRNAIASTENLETICGHITFDSEGEPIGKRAVILKLDDGDDVFYKTVESHRTGK